MNTVGREKQDKGKKSAAGRALIFAAALLLALALLSVGAAFSASRSPEAGRVDFSIENRFISETAMLELSSGWGEIYYTLDGSEPDGGSTLYTGPIELSAGEQPVCYPVKAVSRRSDGRLSETVTKTYFASSGIASRFDCPVVSLTSEPDGLWSEERGILAFGAEAEAFLAANPDFVINKMPPIESANYMQKGREWERPACVEFIDSAGNLILEQGCGVRVAGAWSRRYQQKSLRLFARSEYGESRFDIDFFGQTVLGKSGSAVTSFDTLVLSNGGTSWNRGYVSAPVAARLAAECSVMSESFRPASLFLNGQYYGLIYIKTDVKADFIESVYGLDADQVALLGVGEGYMTEADKYPEQSARYERLYADITGGLLSPGEFLELVENNFDVDNLLSYYAYELYVGNNDWPENNFMFWCWTGEADPANPCTDGRFRFIITDLDMSFFTLESDINLYHEMLYGEESPLFKALMGVPELRSRFVNITCNIMNGVMTEQNITRKLMDAAAEVSNELAAREASDEWGAVANNSFEDKAEAEILLFAATRADTVVERLEQELGVSGKYMLSLAINGYGGVVELGSLELTSLAPYFSGFYYSSCPITLAAEAQSGYVFSRWQVGDAEYFEPELTLTADMIVDGRLSVSAVFEPDSAPPRAVINEVVYKGQTDRIELANPYSEPVDLSGCYLSDSKNNTRMSSLEGLVIEPGGLLAVNCKNYAVINNDLASPIATFNLGEGETLYLFDSGGEIIDSLTLPVCQPGESLARSLSTGRFMLTGTPTIGELNPVLG